jgi:hypothetical protein
MTIGKTALLLLGIIVCAVFYYCRDMRKIEKENPDVLKLKQD